MSARQNVKEISWLIRSPGFLSLPYLSRPKKAFSPWMMQNTFSRSYFKQTFWLISFHSLNASLSRTSMEATSFDCLSLPFHIKRLEIDACLLQCHKSISLFLKSWIKSRSYEQAFSLASFFLWVTVSCSIKVYISYIHSKVVVCLIGEIDILFPAL